MHVLGIIGSPRKNGRTNTLVEAALAGAGAAGAQTETLYLVDYAIKPFTGGGGSREAEAYCPPELGQRCEKADALIVGAPVYYGDINGLTKDWMDTVRIGNANGKPALGIAIAGGSGKGLLSGVQSIYHWFYHRQMRAIDPTPVSRFNWEATLAALRVSGGKLAEMAAQPQPFPGDDREARWGDIVAYYATLPYLNCDPVDEFVMLAEQLVQTTTGDQLASAREQLAQAHTLLRQGRRGEAGRHAFQAYQLLYHAPR